MARRNFEQTVRLAIQSVQAPDVQRIHADLARNGLAEHMAKLPAAGRPQVRTIVDGRIGASEDSVQPHGIIRYEFSRLGDAAAAALTAVQARVPRLTGTYRDSWFIQAGGRRIEGSAAIPADVDQVLVISDEPYSRRLVTGRRNDGRPFILTNLPPGFLELAREEVARAFQAIEFKVIFVELTGRPVDERVKYPAISIRMRG